MIKSVSFTTTEKLYLFNNNNDYFYICDEQPKKSSSHGIGIVGKVIGGIEVLATLNNYTRDFVIITGISYYS